jgi:hypothetical protein
MMMKMMLEFLADTSRLNPSLYLSFSRLRENHLQKSDIRAISEVTLSSAIAPINRDQGECLTTPF